MDTNSEFSYKDKKLFPILHSMRLKDLLDFAEGGRLNISVNNCIFDIHPCVCGKPAVFIVLSIKAKTISDVNIKLEYYCKSCFK